MRPTVVVSIHDVAPSTHAASSHWLDIIEAHRLRATLLVVAGPWNGPRADEDPAFGDWLRAAAAGGHEIAAHGWDHRRIEDPEGNWTSSRRVFGNVAARGCEEFWMLGQREARRRLIRTCSVLHAIGVEADGFTPPGWLASREALDAARGLGFRYRTSHRGVHDLRTGATVLAPAFSHRPGTALTAAAAWGVERLARALLLRGGLVRLALHPDDLDTGTTRDATLRLLARARDADVLSVTYRELVGVGGDPYRSERPASPLRPSAGRIPTPLPAPQGAAVVGPRR